MWWTRVFVCRHTIIVFGSYVWLYSSVETTQVVTASDKKNAHFPPIEAEILLGYWKESLEKHNDMTNIYYVQVRIKINCTYKESVRSTSNKTETSLLMIPSILLPASSLSIQHTFRASSSLCSYQKIQRFTCFIALIDRFQTVDL